MNQSKTRELLQNAFHIDAKVLDVVAEAEKQIAGQFAALDDIMAYNQYKVLAAFQKNRIRDMHFGWTTGYGYDDAGRDAIEQVFADVFHAEAALVRTTFVNGTHALATTLLGVLRPGDELIYATGEPYDTLQTVIGISTNARHLRELADRYKEAQVAIDVGRIFEADKTIINYETLGLGRIIYQLPTTLCEMFLNEVFKKNPIETLDEDTLETINRFFENNLNVSETSRKLYVHRNTLVYRLEKIKKITGLDLREFDHAIVFKVAMMVKMYLDSLNNAKY